MPINSNPKDSAPLRKVMIRHLSGFGFQANHTPFGLACDMVARIGNLFDKTILVLFNLEFLEELQGAGADMGKVRFLADTEEEERFARLVYGVSTILVDEATWKLALENKQAWGTHMGHKLNSAADITLSNPPYNGGIDLKIILAMNEAKLLKRLICVHPSTWLVDVKTQLGPKSGNPLFRKFQDVVRDHVTRVNLFNGNPVFGIGLFVPCVITEVDMESMRQGSILVQDVGQEDYRKVMGLEEITLHGKDWDPTVKEFMRRVQIQCAKGGALGNHRESDVDKWPTMAHAVQLAPMVGHWTASSCLRMVKDDFYTFLQKDPEKNKGVRATKGVGVEQYHVFSFPSQREQVNFLGYLQTDFARLCLALLKTNNKTLNPEVSLVPWLDFSRGWNDDQLFTLLKYPEGHAIREYAKRFLPDYHNIYPNSKTY